MRAVSVADRSTALERAVALALGGVFLCAPLRLLVGAAPSGIAGVLALALAAPLVGLLLATRHRRARFAAYVFLTVDAIRCARAGAWPWLTLDVALVLVLQAPLLRRVFPPIDPARFRRP